MPSSAGLQAVFGVRGKADASNLLAAISAGAYTLWWVVWICDIFAWLCKSSTISPLMYTVTRPWPVRVSIRPFNTNSCIPPIKTHMCAPPPKGACGRALVAQTHAREVAPCGACARVPNARSVPLVVSKKWTRALKKGTIIINMAHGKVIDEDAMIHALEEGWHIQRKPQQAVVKLCLLEFPNITLAAHRHRDAGLTARDSGPRADEPA
ncbi:hypothetical protein B0H10DRAFT_2428251 [Mycena sp. CBHHK59/15]|nr:hypothetical protein B0H10DRAFT_2428251 [Mycena sp. CBHHK59/15]